ncbi:MAG TPA: hypothetical protein VI776_17420 [Anaerolineales bacterium]|nr:hypothetical protein [Anaerolineales bacterium]
MSQLQQNLKQRLPAPLWDAARNSWYSIYRTAQWPAAAFHPWRRASQRQLAGLKDAYRGKRCFIIGNGPSLKRTDLAKLRGEFTFGMNRIYLLFPELGFSTTFFLSVNDLVIEQCAREILALPMPKFLSWRSRTVLRPALEATRNDLFQQRLVFLHTTYSGPKFAADARGRLWEGATVTYVALQLAYHMGFEQVILIGVDHNFSTQGKPNTTVVSQGADPDHFDSRYFGQGFRWQLPDLDTSERAYRRARQVYESAGRQVVDATVGGKLTVFPKVDYDSLFQ